MMSSWDGHWNFGERLLAWVFKGVGWDVDGMQKKLRTRFPLSMGVKGRVWENRAARDMGTGGKWRNGKGKKNHPENVKEGRGGATRRQSRFG